MIKWGPGTTAFWSLPQCPIPTFLAHFVTFLLSLPLDVFYLIQVHTMHSAFISMAAADCIDSLYSSSAVLQQGCACLHQYFA